MYGLSITGTIVDLNVVWLDDYQLAQMHPLKALMLLRFCCDGNS